MAKQPLDMLQRNALHLLLHLDLDWVALELVDLYQLARRRMQVADREGVRQRRLKVYLSDPDVPIAPNHLERGLRCIPMGRRNRLFCWSELGAEHVDILKILLITCRLQGIASYR